MTTRTRTLGWTLAWALVAGVLMGIIGLFALDELPSVSAQDDTDEPEGQSYVTVVVTDDESDPDNVGTSFKITWYDADSCSTNYNAYLQNFDEDRQEIRTHLGSATSDGSQITQSLPNLPGWGGVDVELYCGTYDPESSHNLVSLVEISNAWSFWSDGSRYLELKPGTYTSAPPLIWLAVNPGTLTPSFHRGTTSYTAPDVANTNDRITVHTTAMTGYALAFIKNPSWGVIKGCGVPCSFSYGEGAVLLNDADFRTPGFQIDLDEGENRLMIHVYRDLHINSDLGHLYSLTITRAASEDDQSVERQNNPATGRPNISGTAEVGETLTADTSGIADADGLSEAVFSYQWIRTDLTTDTDIEGATASTYTPVDADDGKAIKVRVSFTDGAGNEETLTSYAVAVQASPLIWLTVSPRTLTPTFHSDTRLYAVSDVPNANDRITVHTTAMTGYALAFIKNPSWGVIKGCGVPCSFSYGEGAVLLNDADFRTPGFQIDLDEGENRLMIHVYRDLHINSDLGHLYSLTVTRVASEGETENDQGVEPQNSPAMGRPSISGEVRVGHTLTADTPGIADADGLTNATLTYQWLADDADIGGATGSTYTLVAADVRKAIRVRVSFTDDAGNQESVTSDPTEEVPGMWAGTVTVGNDPAGSGAVGYSVFAAGMGSITAPDFVANGSGNSVDAVAYNHEGLHLALSRELSTPFTLHVDTKIFDSSSASTSEGSESYIYTWSQPGLNWTKGDSVLVIIVEGKASNPQVASTNSPATGTPTISGSVQVGQTLTVDTSGIADEDGSDNATFTYQWVRIDGTTDSDIRGSTGSTYTLTSDDEGKTIKVRVSFNDDVGNEESLTSTATSAVAAAPPVATPEEEEEQEEQEQEQVVTTPLTATVHNVPGSHNGSAAFTFELRFSETPKDDFSYKTLRDHAFTVTGGELVNARRLERGKNVRWEISVRPSGNADVTVSLPATTDCDSQGAICTGDGRKMSGALEFTVSVQNFAATGEPAITGTARVGETLTASTTGISDANGLTNATYTYEWLADDTEIGGATGPGYTLVAADEGKAIKVQVSFTDDAGNEESLASAATTQVAAAPETPVIPVEEEEEETTLLTASAHGAPDSHDGRSTFTFELRFSEVPRDGFSYMTLRDHAFTVTNGEVTTSRRLERGKNIRWEIHVRPASNAAVTIVLPPTEDCDARGAICTEDGRMLSGRLELTVPGP